MKHALMLVDNFFPCIGGAEKQVHLLCQGLSELGVETEVVTERKEPSWKTAEVIDGIRVRRLAFPKVKFLGSLILMGRLAHYLIRHRKKYDVIHVHIVQYFALVACFIGKIMLKKKVILKFAGSDEALDRGDLFKKNGFNFRYRLLQWGMKKADFGVVVSREMIGDLLRNGFPEEKIRLIPNGIDMKRFLPGDAESDKHALREKLHLNGFFTGVTVGRLVREKAYDQLIDAWQRVIKDHPDAKLIILGDGPLREDLLRLRDEWGLQKSIEFRGMVDNVAEYLKVSDVFIMSSVHEGLSNALLEAMASGCMVLSTSVGGAKDLIQDRENGVLVAPGNPKALAEAVCRIHDNPSESRRMGYAAREKVIAEYGIQRVSRKYLELYGMQDCEELKTCAA